MEGLERKKSLRQSKPTFIIKPRRNFADEGSTVKFKASFDGEPPPDIQWISNQKETIQDGGRFKLSTKGDFHFLEIEDICLEDRGEFGCAITNELGTANVSFALEVFEKPQSRPKRHTSPIVIPPTFEKHLTDVKVTEGEPVTLECSATGSPEPSFSWYLNDAGVPAAARLSTTGQTSYLRLRRATLVDTGTYTCVATSAVGTARTSAMVQVDEEVPPAAPPSFKKGLQDQTVLDGDEVILECEINGDDPDLEVSWLIDSKRVTSSAEFHLERDGEKARMRIVEVYPDDEATYTCVLRNSVGEESTSCVLVVKDNPAVTATTDAEPVKLENIKIDVEKSSKSDVQDTDQVTCEVTHKMEDDVEDEVNCEEIETEVKTKIDDDRLIIDDRQADLKIPDEANIDDNQNIRETFSSTTTICISNDNSKAKNTEVAEQKVVDEKTVLFPVKISAHKLVSLSSPGDMKKVSQKRSSLEKPALKKTVTTTDEKTVAKKSPRSEDKPLKKSTTKEDDKIAVKKGTQRVVGSATDVKTRRGGAVTSKGSSSAESLDGSEVTPQRKQSYVSQVTLAVNNHQEKTPVKQNGITGPTKVPGSNVYEMTLALSDASTKSGKAQQQQQRGGSASGQQVSPARLGLRKSGQVASLASSYLGKSNAVQTRSQSTPFVSSLLKTKSPVSNYQKMKGAEQTKTGTTTTTTTTTTNISRKGLTASAMPKVNTTRGQVNGSNTAAVSRGVTKTKTNGTPVSTQKVSALKANIDASPATKSTKTSASPLRKPQSGIAKLSKPTGSTPTKLPAKLKSPTDKTPNKINKSVAKKASEKSPGGKSPSEESLPEKTASDKSASEESLPVRTASEKSSKLSPDKCEVVSVPKCEDPPVFTKHLEDLTVVDGDRVQLVVEISGAEPMEVCWLHGEDEIKRDDSAIYQVMSEGHVHRLIIAEVYHEDAGTYICEAYNDFGDEDTTCKLIVQDAVTDVQDVVPSNCIPKQQSTLVISESAPSVKKVEEPQRVEERHIDVEECKPVSVPDDDDDKSTKSDIEDDDGLEDDGFFLPEFTRKPKSVTVDEEAQVKFTFQIEAEPPPKVQWEKDGKALTLGDQFKVSVDDDCNYCFEISRAMAADAGRYVCIASNCMGAERCSVSLVVKATDSMDNASDFRSVLRKAKSKPVTPAPTAGVTSPDASAAQHDFRAVLTRHVQTKRRPTVVSELANVNVLEGEPVELTCRIAATPAPDVAWFINGKEIKESKYFHMTYENEIATLHIAEAYPEDEGEYMCKAVNSAGSVSSSCDVLVAELQQEEADEPEEMRDTPQVMRRSSLGLDKDEPPFIEELSPENIQVLRGNSFTLKAKFAGEPYPTVQWNKGGVELSTGGRVRIEVVRDTTTLVVMDSECSDTGCYSLMLNNELGQDSVSSSVTIEDKPDPPVGQPAISSVELTSLSLSWYGPSYDGGSQVTDYRIEVADSGSTKWRTLTSNCKHTSYLVKNLEENKSYQFRISAANKHGFSEPGEPSEVVTMVKPAQQTEMEEEHAFEPKEVVISPNRKFTDCYNLGTEIGKGRFGSVFNCTEKSTGRSFAAKFIKTKASQREEKRLEVTLMNELHHPKLLMLWDAFESPRDMVLVLERIDGGELFERIISSDYVLTERECADFVTQMCAGLTHMHSKHILHLDLKPENVLCVAPNSNAIKLIDFGLARRYDPNDPARVMFGTPEFVAPEVVNYDPISYTTDTWSLGVITYILLSGLSPFMGDNDSETLVNVTMANWDFDDDSFEEISDDAKSFIEDLLVKDSNKRLNVAESLHHRWLTKDASQLSAKRLSTAKHKKFLARRKWQKTGTAIRALGRMAALQKTLANMAKGPANQTTPTPAVGANSVNSADGERQFQTAMRSLRTQLPDTQVSNGRRRPTGATKRQPAELSTSTGVAPVFVSALRDCDAPEGGVALLEVTVSGQPPPEVTWRRGDGTAVGHTRRMAASRREGSDTYSLVVRSCRQSDDGEYECVAHNSAGEAVCAATLRIISDS